MTTIFAFMSEKDKEVRLDVRHEILDIMLGLIEILIVHNVLFPSIALGVGLTIGQSVPGRHANQQSGWISRHILQVIRRYVLSVMIDEEWVRLIGVKFLNTYLTTKVRAPSPTAFPSIARKQRFIPRACRDESSKHTCICATNNHY